MNYTEEQIIAKAKEILKDLKGRYYFEECVNDVAYRKDRVVDFGELEGKKHSIWIVGVKAIFDNEDIMIISDETGEPLYYQNFNTYVYDIEKDEKGYFRVGLPRD